jgi:hypothetical protein
MHRHPPIPCTAMSHPGSHVPGPACVPMRMGAQLRLQLGQLAGKDAADVRPQVSRRMFPPWTYECMRRSDALGGVYATRRSTTGPAQNDPELPPGLLQTVQYSCS